MGLSEVFWAAGATDCGTGGVPGGTVGLLQHHWHPPPKL